MRLLLAQHAKATRLRIKRARNIGKLRAKLRLTLLEQLERTIDAAAITRTAYALRPETRVCISVGKLDHVDFLQVRGRLHTHIRTSLAYLMYIELDEHFD